MATTEVKVPDIGNYTNIPVIEVLVKPGDTVTKDQGLVTLESDKATMEVPSTVAGMVKEVKVKLGDEVSEGAVVAIVETAGAAAAPVAKAETSKPAAAPTKSENAPPPTPQAAASSGRSGATFFCSSTCFCRCPRQRRSASATCSSRTTAGTSGCAGKCPGKAGWPASLYSAC